jgi:hypothetical protein
MRSLRAKFVAEPGCPVIELSSRRASLAQVMGASLMTCGLEIEEMVR